MSLHETHLTGRTRTLRLAGTISLPYYRATDTSTFFNSSNYDVFTWTSARIFLRAYGILIQFFAGHSDTIIPFTGNPVATNSGRYRLKITAPSPLSINYDSNVSLWSANPTLSYSGDITGSFAIEIDVAEERAVTALPFPEIPWWHMSDGPAAVATFREQLTNTNNVRVDVDLGSLTYSNTWSRPSTEYISSLGGDYYANIALGMGMREVFGEKNPTIIMEDTNLWTLRTNQSRLEGYIPYKLGTSALEAVSNQAFVILTDTSNGLSLSGTSLAAMGASAYLEQYVPLLTTYNFKTKCFADDWPSSMIADLKTVQGGKQLTIPIGGVTKAYDAIQGRYIKPITPNDVGFGTPVVTINQNTLYPYTGVGQPSETIEAKVLESSYTQDDETLDTRIQGRGPIFGNLEIAHDSGDALENFNGSTGWTPTNSTLTGTTTLKVTTAGASGSAVKSYSPRPVTEAWRYLDLTVRSNGNANVPFTVRINDTFNFDLTTGSDGAYVTRRLDTCFPDSFTGSPPDQQDSRWPVVGVSDRRPLYNAKHWGLNYIDKIEILSVPASREIELDLLESIRINQPYIQFNSAHYNSKVTWYSTLSRKRHGLFLVDGRTGHELPDMQGAFNMDPLSISDYETEINAQTGWAVTGSGFSDAYFDDSLPSQFIAGEGATYDGSGYTDYTNSQMAAGLLDVPCQFLWDRLIIYPGIGDAWGGGAYEGRLQSYFVKFLRGAGHGFVYDVNGDPVSGSNVTIYRQPNDDARGSGVTDSGGFFTTTLPYGLGNRSHKWRVGSTQIGTAANIYQRKRTRMVGEGPAATGANPDNLATDLGMCWKAYVVADDIWVNYSQHSVPKTWSSEEQATSTADCSDPYLFEDKINGRLVLGYARSGLGIYEKISYDNGLTWEAAVAGITSGTHGRGICSSLGTVLRAAYVAGKVKGTLQYAGDSSASATFNFKDDAGADLSVEDDTFGLAWSWDNSGTVLGTFSITGEGATSDWFSTDDGKTWTRL